MSEEKKDKPTLEEVVRQIDDLLKAANCRLLIKHMIEVAPIPDKQ